jgi:hypothetical protein
MLDMSHHFERSHHHDTEVVDVPTEEKVVMFVQLLYGDGLKHRLMPDHLDLACETDELDHVRVLITPEKLDGEGYCPVCFTPKERERARAAIEKRRADAEAFGVDIQPRRRGVTLNPKPRK